MTCGSDTTAASRAPVSQPTALSRLHLVHHRHLGGLIPWLVGQHESAPCVPRDGALVVSPHRQPHRARSHSRGVSNNRGDEDVSDTSAARCWRNPHRDQLGSLLVVDLRPARLPDGLAARHRYDVERDFGETVTPSDFLRELPLRQRRPERGRCVLESPQTHVPPKAPIIRGDRPKSYGRAGGRERIRERAGLRANEIRIGARGGSFAGARDKTLDDLGLRLRV
jgi:hypothetical protein